MRVQGAVMRSQRVRSCGCEDLDPIGSLRPRPITLAAARRESSWPVGRSELTLRLYVFLHTFRYRETTILFFSPHRLGDLGDFIYASLYVSPLPLTCVSCV